MLDLDLNSWWALALLFIGGAIPWLEAIVVIPAAVVAGFSPVTAVVLAGTGNVVTVGIAAYGGEWIREKIVSWRQRRLATQAKQQTPRQRATRRVKGLRRRNLIAKVMNSGGLPLLALVGPLGLGTQISAVAAVATGLGATRSFIWIAVGTIFWSVFAAILAASGMELFGVSA